MPRRNLVDPASSHACERLSHACLSISSQMVETANGSLKSYSLFDGCCYMDNCGNSRANTCIQARLCRRVVFIRSRTNPGSAWSCGDS